MSTAALVRLFYDELWNRWDDDLVEEVLSPEFEFRGSLGTSTRGLAAWRDYRDTIRAGASDFHNEVVTVVVDRAAAAARLLYSGTHTGAFLGAPATGRSFEYAGAAFFTADDERLTSAWVLADLDRLRPQLTRPDEQRPAYRAGHA